MYAKQKNVAKAKAAPDQSGDIWTWTALDADSKLIVSYAVGGRDGGVASVFMSDVARRLTETLYDMGWFVDLIEEIKGTPGPRGPYKKRGGENSN